MRNEVGASTVLDALIRGIIMSGTELVIDGGFYVEMADYVDSKSLDAISPEQLAKSYAFPGARLLDFGCGLCAYRSMLESFGYDWFGINYKAGMADTAARQASDLDDERINFYDGTNIPFADAYFDVVYSFQTFEHIQDIHMTFAEIQRVLKPGGRLLGAVSYMEQIHDYSTFNFTPYGLKLATQKAGLEINRLYPRSDVFSYLLHRLLVVTSARDETSLAHKINANSTFHQIMSQYASERFGVTRTNLVRLMFCSHFAFDIQKSELTD